MRCICLELSFRRSDWLLGMLSNMLGVKPACGGSQQTFGTQYTADLHKGVACGLLRFFFVQCVCANKRGLASVMPGLTPQQATAGW